MFYIMSVQHNKSFRTGGKTILFNHEQEAAAFADQFMQYAMVRMLQENPFGSGEVLRMMEGGIQIIPIDDMAPAFKADEFVKFENLR